MCAFPGVVLLPGVCREVSEEALLDERAIAIVGALAPMLGLADRPLDKVAADFKSGSLPLLSIRWALIPESLGRFASSASASCRASLSSASTSSCASPPSAAY